MIATTTSMWPCAEFHPPSPIGTGSRWDWATVSVVELGRSNVAAIRENQLSDLTRIGVTS